MDDFLRASRVIPRAVPKARQYFGRGLSPFVDEAIEAVVHTMRTTKKDAVRLACCREIFDRFAGKSVANTEMDISVLFQRKLLELE
jgi:hypothetical protein